MASAFWWLRRLMHLLSRPALQFFVLPWLMLLLVLGTVAQRYIGLYDAQRIFFGSFVLWVGIIPLPGAYAALSLIALGLIAKLAQASSLDRKRLGVTITHVSALVLLIGGLLTALTRQEGYLALFDGDQSHLVSDYNAKELVILKQGKPVLREDFSSIHVGWQPKETLPFHLSVRMACSTCGTIARTTPMQAVKEAAQAVVLTALPPDKEEAKRKAGIEFSIEEAGSADGIYIAYQGLRKPTEFAVGADHYQVIVRAAERTLPFDVRLQHFTKAEYPGTAIARDYHSDVIVSDGARRFPVEIGMNQPLRYRGYTLYQSSYGEEDGKTYSVLAVVKNSGAPFPYFSIALLCIGMGLHLLTRRVPQEKDA